MFRFADSYYLYLLLLLPLMVALFIWSEWYVRRRISRYGDWKLLSALAVGVSRGRRVFKFVLYVLAYALLIVALARPQFGTHEDKEQKRGIEAVIALDVSNSMLAEDVSPNRLDRAKMLVSTLVDKMSNDKVGLDVFAGDAFVQLPITNDYVSAKMFLDAINPGMISTQGTDLAAAITLASKSFTQEKGVGKAIIIITDGENHEPDAEEAAKQAAKEGKYVYILGVGSATGAPIPMGNGYLTDNTGEVVVTKLNEDMCRKVAAAGKGTYIHVDNSMNAQEALQQELSKLAKKESSTPVYSEFDEQFQAFVLLALFLLILEVAVSESKNPIFRKLNLFRR